MRETGIIVANQGRVARVRILHSPQCEGCPGCIDLGERQERFLDAENALGAEVGARVECEIPSRQLLGHSFLVFILPLCFMIAGYLLTVHFRQNEQPSGEGPGIAGAFAGLLVAYLLIRVIDRHWGKKHTIMARITGYAPAGEAAGATFTCPSSEH